MAYAVTQDAIDLYGDTFVLTSVAREDSPAPDPLDNALAKASDEMDSYIAAAYTVPISPVPDIVVRYCIDIGIYIASADTGVMTEEKRTRYEDAIKWLDKLAKGVVVLPNVVSDPVADLPQISGPTRLFSRGTMGGL